MKFLEKVPKIVTQFIQIRSTSVNGNRKLTSQGPTMARERELKDEKQTKTNDGPTSGIVTCLGWFILSTIPRMEN